MSFRKLQCCMAYMVLAVSLVGGIYIIIQGLSGFCVFMGAYYSTAIQIFLYDGFSFFMRIYLYGGCFFQQYLTA